MNALEEFLTAVAEVHPDEVGRMLDVFRVFAKVPVVETPLTKLSTRGGSDDGLKVDLDRAYVADLLRKHQKQAKAAKAEWKAFMDRGKVLKYLTEALPDGSDEKLKDAFIMVREKLDPSRVMLFEHGPYPWEIPCPLCGDCVCPASCGCPCKSGVMLSDDEIFEFGHNKKLLTNLGLLPAEAK